MDNPSPAEFSTQFPDEQLRTIQIICGALNLGLILFLGVIFTLSILQEPIADSGFNYDIILIVTAIAVLGSILAYPLSVTLFNNKLRSSTSAESFQKNLMMAYILRLAVLEGAAFVGLTALLLAVLDSSLFDHLFYWVNLLPLFVMILVTVTNFPTRDYIRQLYEVHFYYSK